MSLGCESGVTKEVGLREEGSREGVTGEDGTSYLLCGGNAGLGADKPELKFESKLLSFMLMDLFV